MPFNHFPGKAETFPTRILIGVIFNLISFQDNLLQFITFLI